MRDGWHGDPDHDATPTTQSCRLSRHESFALLRRFFNLHVLGLHVCSLARSSPSEFNSGHVDISSLGAPISQDGNGNNDLLTNNNALVSIGPTGGPGGAAMAALGGGSGGTANPIGNGRAAAFDAVLGLNAPASTNAGSLGRKDTAMGPAYAPSADEAPAEVRGLRVSVWVLHCGACFATRADVLALLARAPGSGVLCVGDFNGTLPCACTTAACMTR